MEKARLIFWEIQRCEGYYYNVRTGALLRVVGPGEERCWTDEPPEQTGASDAPEFVLVTPDVQAPFGSVQQQVQERYGCTPSKLQNRQTASQPDGSIVTEEAGLTTSAGPDTCRTSI